MFLRMLFYVGAVAALVSCGPEPGSVSSAGTLPPAANAAAVIADAAGTPPPVSFVNTAKAHAAVDLAREAVDLAASGADVALTLKPSFRGTPAARKLAAALETAAAGVATARQAISIGDAASYQAALDRAEAAMRDAKPILLALKGDAR